MIRPAFAVRSGVGPNGHGIDELLETYCLLLQAEGWSFKAAVPLRPPRGLSSRRICDRGAATVATVLVAAERSSAAMSVACRQASSGACRSRCLRIRPSIPSAVRRYRVEIPGPVRRSVGRVYEMTCLVDEAQGARDRSVRQGSPRHQLSSNRPKRENIFDDMTRGVPRR